MTQDELVNSLLLSWEEQRSLGREVPLDDLCRDHPELLERLQGRIALLKQMKQLAGDPGQTPAAGFAVTLEGPGDYSRQTMAGAESSGDGSAIETLVPGYEILGELGRGGMGVVYRARQQSLNRLVALKMILAGSHADSTAQARFTLEAETIGRLRHPHVVQVYECGRHNGRPYFSLELMEGGSLADRLAGEPRPPHDAARLVAALADAVGAAHALGIIHRDLKPANVLLDRDGNPKVTDFGLAKQLDADQVQTGTGSILGTPSYMAPEQARGTDEVGPPADIYALGAILYELLTGRPPFRGATPWDTIQMVVGNEPVAPRQLNSAVPRNLETVCLKCLHKDPRRRYDSAADLADDLRRFLDDRPVKARPVGAAERFVRACRRNPAIASLILLLSLALLGGLTASTLLMRQAMRQRGEADAQRHLAELNAQVARRQQKQAEQQEQVARDEAQRANAAAQFLTDLFRAADLVSLGELSPLRSQLDDDLKAIDIIDRGAELILSGEGQEASVRGELADSLGNVYCSIGYPWKAKPLLEIALAHRRSRKSDPVRMATTVHNLGWLHHQLGNHVASRRFYEEAIHLRRQLPEQHLGDLSTSLLGYGWLMADMEEHETAEQMMQESIEIRRRLHGPHSRSAAVANFGLAGVMLDQGKIVPAFKPLSDAVASLRQSQITVGIAELITLYQQAIAIRSNPLGANPQRAAEMLQRSLELANRLMGPNSAFTGFTHHELAFTYCELKQYDKAEQHFQECVRIAAPFGLDHPRVQVMVRAYCNMLAKIGRREEAFRLIDQAQAKAEQRDDDPCRLASIMVLRGELLDRPEERERSSALLRDALSIYRKTVGPPRFYEMVGYLILGEQEGGREAFELAAELAVRLTALPEGPRRLLAGEFVVDLLRRARKDRFPEWATARTDPRFDAVRGRADFAKLFPMPQGSP